MTARSERLMSNAQDVDAIVIMNGGEPFLDSTFWYITEQAAGAFEGAIAIISKDGTLDVIINPLEEESAKACSGNVHIYHGREERDNAIKSALGDAKVVGVHGQAVPYAYVQFLKKVAGDIEIKDSTKSVYDTVAVKDAKEIDLIEKACKISSKVASELPSMIAEGATEKVVSAAMDARMRELGGTGNAFETIAAFGPASAEPHHRPCDYGLKKGDTALFDFGSKYGMYCSDLTRTIFLGDSGDVLRRAYEVVREAQEVGISLMKDGVPAKDVDIAARNIIDASEFKGRFIHSFGHGIGMDVHQAISVSPNSEDILREGNIVSAEPGIYIPGLGGIRIEDTMLVTKNGARRLTDYDHGFTVV